MSPISLTPRGVLSTVDTTRLEMFVQDQLSGNNFLSHQIEKMKAAKL